MSIILLDPLNPFDMAVLGLRGVDERLPRDKFVAARGRPPPIAMQFTLVDRILKLDPGRRLVAVKNLTLAEEYLAEHFPGFPVLPGVLMLESITQASAWLVRVTEDYAHSIVVLKSAKAVRYGSFVTPGCQLVIETKLTRLGENDAELQAKGVVDGVTAVSGRVVLEMYNLSERDPAMGGLDIEVISQLRRQFQLLARDWLRVSKAPETALSEVETTTKG